MLFIFFTVEIQLKGLKELIILFPLIIGDLDLLDNCVLPGKKIDGYCKLKVNTITECPNF